MINSTLQGQQQQQPEPLSSFQGRFVNYANLPDILWETIFPQHFGLILSDTDIDRLKEIATKYSKGRGIRVNQKWEDDRASKHDSARKEMSMAAEMFLKPSFDRLQELSNAQ